MSEVIFYYFIIVNYDFIMQSFIIATLKEDRQVLEFINQVVDSDDEDDGIFEPEIRFSIVFNTFMSQ